MADPKFFDWFEGDAGLTRGIDFGNGQTGVDVATSVGINRTINSPRGTTAKSFIPASNGDLTNPPQAVLVPQPSVAPAKPVAPVVPSTPAAPVASAPAQPAAFGSQFIPSVPVSPVAPTPSAAPSYVSAAPSPEPLRTPRKDGRLPVDARALPRIFNPLAVDPNSPTTPLGSTEPGAQKLYDYLKTNKKAGYAIKSKLGQVNITGKNPGELATNWVQTMKNLRGAGDQSGVSQMQNISSTLFE